jgi:hypothetical protein
MSDLEAEQDKSSSMATALKDCKEQNDELLAAKDKAEGRTKNLLSQLSKASEASVAMSDRMTDMQAQLQVTVVLAASQTLEDGWAWRMLRESCMSITLQLSTSTAGLLPIE